MLAPGIIEWISLVFVFLSAAFLVASLVTRDCAWRKSAPGQAPGADDAIFLFEDATLTDTTEKGNTLLGGNAADTDWARLAAVLTPRFPAFPTDWQTALRNRRARYRSVDPTDDSEVLLETLGDLLRVHLRTLRRDNGPDEAADLRRELKILQTAADASPFPAWQRLDSGAVGWHNAAYARLYEKLHGTAPDPQRPIVQTLLDDRTDDGRVRSSITVHGSDQTYWFDVSVVQHRRFRMFYAQDVNAVVSAEVAQRNFVQTLAKTFAQLSIGLAIFDRERRLVLFNPALIDLTALPADFLSVRPDLATFFDRLRDNQMMPEPKNYGSWREQMADLVAAAADGRYQETWSLPSGSVYQVSGRPHPDGAVAFLFEDITAEVTLTRRFRSDVELGQSVLDRLDDAIAVFSASGMLIFSNKAYGALWSVDPDRSFAETTIRDTIRDWQSASVESSVWAMLLTAFYDPTNRQPNSFRYCMTSGQQMVCNMAPILGGATLIVFRKASAAVGSTASREMLNMAR